MEKKSLKTRVIYQYHNLIIIPLIVAGGRLVGRIFLNLWNMIES